MTFTNKGGVNHLIFLWAKNNKVLTENRRALSPSNSDTANYRVGVYLGKQKEQKTYTSLENESRAGSSHLNQKKIKVTAGQGGWKNHGKYHK